MSSYKEISIHLAAAVADAIEGLEGLESHVRTVKKALIKAQQETEEAILDVHEKSVVHIKEAEQEV